MRAIIDTLCGASEEVTVLSLFLFILDKKQANNVCGFPFPFLMNVHACNIHLSIIILSAFLC